MKKNKRGRPREDLAKKVDFKKLRKLAKAGLTDVQLAVVFDVVRDTISEWKKNKRLFLHLRGGKDRADKKVVKKPKCSCGRKKARVQRDVPSVPLMKGQRNYCGVKGAVRSVASGVRKGNGLSRITHTKDSVCYSSLDIHQP